MGVLTDGKATRTAILAKLDDLVAIAKPQDTIVLFFAGHGLIDGERRLRLSRFP